MSTYNDGGPAFPRDGTLGDYFAARADPFDSDCNPSWIAHVLGWPPPNVDEMTHNEWLLWRCRADAAYKYMQADAMLEAREKKT